MSNNSNGSRGLRDALESVIAEHGGSMKTWTVLDAKNDPYRYDTPENRKNGGWLAATLDAAGLADRTLHVRGLHYALIGALKPDGATYENNQDDYDWLGRVALAARWLGFVDWDKVIDQRNEKPFLQVNERSEVTTYVTVGAELTIPSVDEIVPRVAVDGFEGRQAFQLVMYGEKSSLAEVLSPLARDYGADLYLPTGESSTTFVHMMCKRAYEDGRRMVVFYFADCDPSGYQMSISVARKMQAFTDLHFPGLNYELRRVALTPDQVRAHRLPHAPMKETERRRDRWLAAMGVEQTEIDSIATLNPRLLRRLARKAIDPFYDKTLKDRVDAARQKWLDEAQRAFDSQVGDEQLTAIHREAEERIGVLEAELAALNEKMNIPLDGFELPDGEIPGPEIDVGGLPQPLIDSRWAWHEQTQRLIENKRYSDV